MAVVVTSVYLYYNSNNRPASTPAVMYTSNISPTISLQTTGGISNVINVSQGATQQINLTLTSLYSSQIVAIPIENLRLLAYNSAIDYKNWDTSNWNTSIVQEKVFTYSFSLSELTLQPNMSNSTIITLSLTNNAPLGRYALWVNLGDIKFLSTNENDELILFRVNLVRNDCY